MSECDPTDVDTQGEAERDQLFSSLADPRRRFAIRYLRDTDRPTALADLARGVAAKESDVDESEISTDATQQVYLALYHVHLPQLEEADVVDFNDERNTVHRGDAFSDAVSLLQLI